MKNLSHFDEKSQSFWPSQVGSYAGELMNFMHTSMEFSTSEKYFFMCIVLY